MVLFLSKYFSKAYTLSFQTDPENTDYTMEEGAIRNFEAFRLAQKQAEKDKQDKEDEEVNNPMKVGVLIQIFLFRDLHF